MIPNPPIKVAVLIGVTNGITNTWEFWEIPYGLRDEYYACKTDDDRIAYLAKYGKEVRSKQIIYVSSIIGKEDMIKPKDEYSAFEVRAV